MTDLFDAALAPETEPVTIIAGDLVQWRRTDYPLYATTGFSLLYVFRPAAGGAQIEATASIVAGEFRVSLASAVTATMMVARWYWSSFLIRESDGSRVQIDDGEVLVQANRQVDSSDTRSHARRVLDAIEASIEGRASDTVQSYTIGGRQINKMDAGELIKWRNYYIEQVRAEEDAARRADGLPSRNTIQVRFT